MPALFDRVGIRFQYPENWSLDDTDVLSGRHSVTVESPSGALWAVSRQDSRVDPQELAESALAAIQEEYSEVEVEPVEDQFGELPAVGYDLHFFYLDFVTQVRIRAVRTVAASYLIHCQAETRDFDELAPVFDAMQLSLLLSAGSEEGEYEDDEPQFHHHDHAGHAHDDED